MACTLSAKIAKFMSLENLYEYGIFVCIDVFLCMCV